MMRRDRRGTSLRLLAVGGALIALILAGLVQVAWHMSSSDEALGATHEQSGDDGTAPVVMGPEGSSGDTRGDSDAPSLDEDGEPSDGDLERLLQEVPLPEDVLPQARPDVTTRSGDLQQVAVDLLTSYRDAHDCVLARSGYLDLFGSVWGCVVRGGDWVDICIVTESAEGTSCEVRVLRLDRDEAVEALGETEANGEVVP